MIPPKPGSGLDRVLRQQASSQGLDAPWKDDPFWTDVDPEKLTPQEDMIRKRGWRATPNHIERLQVILEKFEKTHHFHNFTVARDPKDKTNHRFMKKLEVRWFTLSESLCVNERIICIGRRASCIRQNRVDSYFSGRSKLYSTSGMFCVIRTYSPE